MEWLSQHSSALNFVVNLGMFFVWVAYLQVFLMTYIRARRPRVIINRARGTDLDSLCMVSNMSQEPIYAQTVYCTVRRTDGECSATITDREILQEAGRGERPDGVTSQGPLSRGEFMTIGTFRNLLTTTLEQSEDCAGSLEEVSDTITGFEIMVVSAFGGDDLEIAAKRAFRIDTDRTPWAVVPERPETEQVSSRSERKQIRRMIVDELRQA